ncbi:MAG: sugar transferase [Firmicutes bacterium]|nr:sugar transferase [Bacillota bacterium]
MQRRRENSWFKHLDFIILDMVAANIAFLLAYMLRNSFTMPFHNPTYRGLFILIPVFMCLSGFFRNSYSGILRRGYLKELRDVIMQSITVEAALMLYLFFTKAGDQYSRLVLAYFWGIEIILLTAVRILRKKQLWNSTEKIAGKDVLLVVTPEVMFSDTVDKCMKQAYQTFQLKYAVLDRDRVGEEAQGVPIVANDETLKEYAISHVVDRVLLRFPDGDPRPDELIEKFLDLGVTVHMALPRAFRSLPHSRVDNIGESPVLTASMTSATPGQLFFKRAMDICGSVVGLMITAVAFVFVAPVIYIQSPGPVFFSQTRIGRNGRKFKIYKFRSMYMDAEERKKELMAQNKMSGLMFKMDDDPRITPIGKFIRKTSIDELPQFWNVFKGDMSLVGTRPPTLDEYEQYEVHHKSRLAGKPGITGLWQVSGRSDITDFEEVVRLDRQYLSEWNLGLDIKILFKTVVVVFGKVGSV